MAGPTSKAPSRTFSAQATVPDSRAEPEKSAGVSPSPESEGQGVGAQAGSTEEGLAQKAEVRARIGWGRRCVQWATASRWRLALVVGGGFVVGSALVTGIVIGILRARQPPPLVTLEMALEVLDQGAYPEARHLAEELALRTDLGEQELGGPVFILGAVTACEARELSGEEQKARYLVAAGYLEEARARGFPPSRRAEGLFLLAESLFHSGQWVAARPVLKEALQANPQRKMILYDMLVQACAEAVPPLLKEALEYNTAQLADQWLPQAQKQQALLRQAELQFRLGDLDACRKSLAMLPEDPALRAGKKWIEGQIRLRQARAASAQGDPATARQKYQEAIHLFRQAQADEEVGSWAMCRAQYSIAICLEEMGDVRAAAKQFERVRTTFSKTPEATAAAWKEAELAPRLYSPQEVLAAYRRAIELVGLPKTFHNPWLSIEDIRSGCLKTHQEYLSQGKYSVAFSLAQSFAPLLSPEATTQLLAETLSQWAQAEATKAQTLSDPKRTQQERQARTLFRQAGSAYQQLAELEKQTRRYTDLLWRSAENYLAGQDYPHAVVVLKEYLKNETRARRGAALVHLGEALLSLDRVEEAMDALRDCIDFHPRDVAAFQARLLAARAWIEKGELDKAAQILQENLDGRLAPSSVEWRQTLFAMGRVRHLQSDYEKAVLLLQEALQRYPDDPEALEARYLLADSHRRIGLQIREQLLASQVRHVRLSRMQESQSAFQKALAEYKELLNRLSRQQIDRPLNPWEKVLLRNTLFGMGDAASRLGHYDAALEAYTAVANRFQSEPVALVAYVQMASVYRELAQPDRARQILRQAQLVLNRLPEDPSFTKTTPMARSEWVRLIQQQLADLESPGS